MNNSMLRIINGHADLDMLLGDRDGPLSAWVTPFNTL
jgi:hypothetical protein